MSKRIRILIAEDNPHDAELLVRELQRAGFDFEWQRVDTEADYLAKLKPDIDLILSDFEMPQFSGLRALQLLNQQPELDIPFIIVSGTIGEETAVAAMREGAVDYLLKDRIARLGSAVQRALNVVSGRSERKRLEAQFIEAQKMEVVGQLAGGVAHDFNNVLAVIMGYGDLIVQELSPDHPLQKYIGEIRHAARRAAGLTQQLLIFSRKETVQPVELDLNDVVMDMEKMLRQLINENIDLTIACETGVSPIRADAGYIWQVLMNLVVNARDAMPHGGKIIVKTSDVHLATDDPRAPADALPGDYVMLSVTDTGVGMTEEVKERLFEAFFTTKVAGKGTTFRVYFPRIAPPARATSVILTHSGRVRSGTETLLVVEDEPALRHLAQGILEIQGYNVLTAPNGQDALRVAREHQGPPISLVVTDVVMPRMGGKVMAEWLKATNPELKILFTSGYSEDTIAHHGVLEEGVEFLPKPYTPAGLALKVGELLDH